jgi:hypothetical protein
MPEGAVDEFLRTHAAMQALTAAHEWARPMLLTIAVRQMASTPLGLKLRVTIGAVLSVADVVSDLYMIIKFLENGNTAAAYGTIGTIGLNMLLQIVLVVYQNKHRGQRVVVYEVGFVVCFLKPVVDAFHVASGHGQLAGAPLDPMMEMITSKGIEMVTQSTPSVARSFDASG